LKGCCFKATLAAHIPPRPHLARTSPTVPTAVEGVYQQRIFLREAEDPRFNNRAFFSPQNR
jgi:hypothetical protein